jgi:hypothetical protein
MKKTSEALSEAQDQAAIRRQLLDSGRIRLVRQKPKPPAQQDIDETKEAKEAFKRDSE